VDDTVCADSKDAALRKHARFMNAGLLAPGDVLYVTAAGLIPMSALFPAFFASIHLAERENGTARLAPRRRPGRGYNGGCGAALRSRPVLARRDIHQRDMAIVHVLSILPIRWNIPACHYILHHCGRFALLPSLLPRRRLRGAIPAFWAWCWHLSF